MMLWNFIITFCLLVQLFLVDSIEVREDVIEDSLNISKNSTNNNYLVNTTMVDVFDEVNSTKIVNNNVTIDTNLNSSEYKVDESLKNSSKTFQEDGSFENKANSKIFEDENENTQENITLPVKYKKSASTTKVISTEIKSQAFLQSSNPQTTKKGLMQASTAVGKDFSQSSFIPSPEIKSMQEKFSATSRNSGVKLSDPVKRYPGEIRLQPFLPQSSSQSIKDKFVRASIDVGVKSSVPVQGYFSEINLQSLKSRPQSVKKKFVSAPYNSEKDFSQPIFMPSPEVRVNNFGSPILFEQDSFQPIRYPILPLNKKDIPTPTRRIFIEYHKTSKPKDIRNGESNYSEKGQILKSAVKGEQPNRQITQVKRRNEQGNWVILDDSREVLRPEKKIINFDQYEHFYDQDDLKSSTVIPVHEEIHGDHPYPFEYVKDVDSSNWLHSSSPPLEGVEYDDHSYEVPPPPSPSRPHSFADTHPDWESKFTRGKEIVKPSPLRSILHVLGAIVPIGLLLSALTPNVVMINPNATSTLKQTPGDLNLFRGSQRSLNDDESYKEKNFDSVIRKLTGVKGEKHQIKSNCDKKQICEHLALHGAALKDLQKTIESILHRSPSISGEVNVSMDELFAAARGGSCSSTFICKEIVTTVTASD